MTKKNYDSTVARIAGNLLSGVLTARDYVSIANSEPFSRHGGGLYTEIKRGAVIAARAIVEEVQRTEPAAADDTAAVKQP